MAFYFLFVVNFSIVVNQGYISYDIVDNDSYGHIEGTIVYFKRLGSRHFLKEMKIQSILLKYNTIFRKTNLKQFLKYIQQVSNHPDYQI